MLRFNNKNKSNKGNVLKNGGIIVEFVGPPGAGKTTNCECFAKLLTEKNFNVCTSQNIKVYISTMNLYIKMMLLSKTLFSKGHIFLLFTFVLAFNKIYSFNSIYRFIRLSVFDMALNNYIENKGVDIVLLDQWAIQELWSATIFKLNSYDKVKEQLKRFYLKTDFVLYFDLKAEIASERIKTRETKLSRFDKMDPKIRIGELIKHNPYLLQLYQNSDCKHKYIFSAELSPYENAENFYQKLMLFS